MTEEPTTATQPPAAGPDNGYKQALDRAYTALQVPELKQELISAEAIEQTGNLKPGAKNEAQVKALQAALNVFLAGNDLPGIEVNGKYDKQTIAAVKTLQKAYGMRQTGIYDVDSAKVLTGDKMALAQIREEEKYKDYTSHADDLKNSRFFRGAEPITRTGPGANPPPAQGPTPPPPAGPTPRAAQPAAGGYPPADGDSPAQGQAQQQTASQITPEKLNKLRELANQADDMMKPVVLKYANALETNQNVDTAYAALRDNLAEPLQDQDKAAFKAYLDNLVKTQGHGAIVDLLLRPPTKQS